MPGGLFGTSLPYNLNTVTATDPAGRPGRLRLLGVRHHGADPHQVHQPAAGHQLRHRLGGSPITLHLTTGTTNPPAPNTPISGRPGHVADVPGPTCRDRRRVQVDNTFAVPAATNCGVVAPAAVTKAINKQLGLPSAAGTNAATITSDHYFTYQAVDDGGATATRPGPFGPGRDGTSDAAWTGRPSSGDLPDRRDAGRGGRR